MLSLRVDLVKKYGMICNYIYKFQQHAIKIPLSKASPSHQLINWSLYWFTLSIFSKSESILKPLLPLSWKLIGYKIYIIRNQIQNYDCNVSKELS